MKINKSILIIMTLLILTIAFIWLNSLQNNSISYSISNNLADKILRIFLPKGVTERTDFYFLVRKAAHATEFFILGILTAFLKILLKKINLFAGLFFLLAAAVTDEALQMFSDRNSNVMDIIIDFGGAISGLILVFAIHSVFLRLSKRHKQNSLRQSRKTKEKHINSG